MDGRFPRYLAMFCLLAGVSAWIAFSNTAIGDYDSDAGRAVGLLAVGDLSGYLSAHPLMGPAATLLMSAFAAVNPIGLAQYQWATLPCLLVAGALGIYLSELAGRRGAAPLTRFLIAGLCLVNPITFEAVRSGHPEEILTTALAVAAVATAAEGHRWRAALLLGLAIASKQWAVIAILPVLLALPSRRFRAVALAAGVVAVLTLPGLIAAPDAFYETQARAASGGAPTTPWTIWFPFANHVTRHISSGSVELTAHLNETPSAISTISHPLILVLALLLPLALCLRLGRWRLRGSEAMALLALLALLRCALDPLDNLYYHAPLLLALIGWDAFAPRGLPVRGLAGAAVALLFFEWSRQLGNVDAFSHAYIAVIVAAGAAIAISLFKPTSGFEPVTPPRRFAPAVAAAGTRSGEGGIRTHEAG